MSKFLSLDRSSIWPEWLRPWQRSLEHAFGVARLNALLDVIANEGEQDVINELGQACGFFQVEGRILPSVSPAILFSNHPLGGADTVAAMAMLRETGELYSVLVNEAIRPPSLPLATFIPVDPVNRRRNRNVSALLRLTRQIKNGTRYVLIYPAGICSRFDVRTLRVSDPPWHDTYLRLAQLTGADLIPIWFSGRNSVLFYVLAALFGRVAGMTLAAEFFRHRSKKLTCKIGGRISKKDLPFLGENLNQALRAAVYSLAHQPLPVHRSGFRPSPPVMQSSRTVCIAVLTADTVDRAQVVSLRTASFGTDSWSEVDQAALHLTASIEGQLVGYYRVLDWRNLSNSWILDNSPVASVYHVDFRGLKSWRILELGRFCMSPSLQSLRIIRSLWKGVHSIAAESTNPCMALGMITLDHKSPVVAAAQFEYLRRIAPCPRTQDFVAREELVPPSPHYEFNPRSIVYTTEPKVADIPPILKTYHLLGAKFGPSAYWRSFGQRSAVLTSITLEELRQQTR